MDVSGQPKIELKTGTSQKAIILMILCTIFTSLGQILWKFGVARINFSVPLTIINLPFILGFVSYGLGALLMLMAFESGELSVLYPIIATSYIWVSLISPVLFPADSMNLLKWSGVTLILVSVSLLGYGSQKKEQKEKQKQESSAEAVHG